MKRESATMNNRKPELYPGDRIRVVQTPITISAGLAGKTGVVDAILPNGRYRIWIDNKRPQDGGYPATVEGAVLTPEPPL